MISTKIKKFVKGERTIEEHLEFIYSVLLTIADELKELEAKGVKVNGGS